MADQSDIGARRVPSALFSKEAADNAEVVPSVPPPRGPDSMWSTRGPARDDEPAEPATPTGGTDLPEDDPWHRMGSPTPPPGAVPPFRAPSGTNGTQRSPGSGVNGSAAPPEDPWRTVSRPVPPPGVSGVFSAEPVDRDDVVDHDEVLAELLEDDDPGPRGPGPVTNPFATTRGGAPPPPPPPAAPEDPWIEWHDAGTPEHAAAEPAATARPAPPPPFVGRNDVGPDTTRRPRSRTPPERVPIRASTATPPVGPSRTSSPTSTVSTWPSHGSRRTTATSLGSRCRSAVRSCCPASTCSEPSPGRCSVARPRSWSPPAAC